MRRSGRVVFLFAFSLLVLTFHSCSDDDIKETYPSIVSEFSDIYSNDKGTLYQFVTDSQKKFLISNTLTGYAASRIYRGLCGYVANGERATLYQLQAAYVLRDSTATPRRDPTAVLSVWSTDRYINMQLQPRTQGGRQYWGYCTDSVRTKHIFLSLYHNQNERPRAAIRCRRLGHRERRFSVSVRARGWMPPSVPSGSEVNSPRSPNRWKGRKISPGKGFVGAK